MRNFKLGKIKYIISILALILGIGGIFFISNSLNQSNLSPDNSMASTIGAIERKVHLVIIDPTQSNGKKLSQNKNWNDSKTLANQVIEFWKTVSRGFVNYKITKETNIDRFYPKIDGFTFTEQTYNNCLINSSTCHIPDEVNWDLLDSELQICNGYNNEEYDEIWLFGAPWFGFYESRLIGPNAFSCNSPPLIRPACKGLVAFVGFTYERGLNEGIENFFHRFEATMSQVYGSWQENRTSHNWDKFGLVKAQSPNYQYSGCGSAHYTPNSTRSYEYDNPTIVNSFCDDFYSYPNLPNSPLLKPISCAIWGCTQIGYDDWYFKHLPQKPGNGLDGKLNNWFYYLANPNTALTNQEYPTIIPTATPTETTAPNVTTLTPTPTSTPTPTPRLSSCEPLDKDGNNILNYIDLYEFIANYTKSCTNGTSRNIIEGCGSQDINNDNIIDFKDLFELIKYYYPKSTDCRSIPVTYR